MFRKVVFLSICACALLPGCERREPEEPEPRQVVRVPQERPQVPPGMTPIREGASVFISESPVTVGEYVEYLRATDQGVPSRWRGVEPGTPGARAPVTGLSRQEAEFYALYRRQRLPTATEWRVAGAVVGARPYPWDDGEPAAPDAELFLAQDWVPGTEAEEEAHRRAAALPDLLLAHHQEELDESRAALEQLVEEHEAQTARLWEELRPAFFAMIDRQRELARHSARQERRLDSLEVVESLFRAKREMVAQLPPVVDDLSPEEADRAVQRYDDLLAETLEGVQQVEERLGEDIRELQEQVVALTRRFEQHGEGLLRTGTEEARRFLAELDQEAESVLEAVRRKSRLQEVKEELRAVEPGLEGMPSLEQVRRRTAELEGRLDDLTEDPRIQERIEEVQDGLRSIGEAIGREFTREEAVFEQLPPLVELRARKEGARAAAQTLREALGPAAEPQQAPQEQSA